MNHGASWLSGPKGVYVRKASGLVRNFSLLETYALNMGSSCTAASFIAGPLAAATSFPGAHMSYILISGFAVTIFQVLTYMLLSMAMPRSGGDFVWSSQNLHPAVGFAASWILCIAEFFALGIYAAWTVNYVMAGGVLSVGLFSNNPALVNFGSLLTTANYTFAFGLIFLISAGAFVVFGSKYQGRALTLGLIGNIWIPVLLAWVLVTTTHSQYVTLFNQFNAPFTHSLNTYQDVLNQYAKLGGTFPKTDIMASLGAITIGFWYFLGPAWSGYVGGEVKNPRKSQPLAMIMMMVTLVVMFAAIFGRWYDVVGWDFTNALASLSLGPNYPLAAPPTVNFLLGMLIPNVFLQLSLMIAMVWSLWTLNLVILISISRFLFSYSFAQILPSKLADVHPRYHSPWVAAVASIILGGIMCAVYSYTPSALALLYNEVTMLVMCFCVGCIGGIFFPFRKKELFEASPRMVRARIGGVPVISIIAVLGSAGMAGVVLGGLSAPGSMVGNGFILATTISGVVIYYVARAYRLKQGINLDLAFRELPPE